MTYFLKGATLRSFLLVFRWKMCYIHLWVPWSYLRYQPDLLRIKVAEHSFLVPMRHSSLFSNHWHLGSQNWQGASSTKKVLYFDMFHWTRYRYHGNTAGSKPALNNGFDLFSENPVVRFFSSFVSRKLRKILAY